MESNRDASRYMRLTDFIGVVGSCLIYELISLCPITLGVCSGAIFDKEVNFT